jgi:hypothetical protein
MSEIKTLDDSQLEDFDIAYVDDVKWEVIRRCIDRDFPQGDFHLLDLGGGNGRFADLVLSNYPGARATVLDNARTLLARNSEHPRKTLLYASAAELDEVDVEPPDLITINWVLHHLVSDSHARSVRNMMDTLGACVRALTGRGRISVFEDLYDGILLDGLPSRLIFLLTSSRALSGLVGRMGANTAGVGVCFRSHRQWKRLFMNAGLELLEATRVPGPRAVPLRERIALHVGDRARGHYWLQPPRA